MTIINWIFIGLSAVDIGLLVISLIKKNELLEKISSALLFPLALIHPPLLLQEFLPDSYHIIFFSIFALSLLTLSIGLIVFFKSFRIKAIAYFLYFSGIAAWCELFRTFFYIYRLPQWALTLIIIIYALILILVLAFSGRKKIYEYICKILFLGISEVLNVLALTSLIYEHSGKSILLFAGSLCNLLTVIFNFFDESKFHLKHGMLIRAAALSASQFMIAFAPLLMFY
ncbi:MAG: hypothetical protein IJ688_12215 [Treponema sp.]|nr:hypothetical protein [Treponema sp.]